MRDEIYEAYFAEISTKQFLTETLCIAFAKGIYQLDGIERLTKMETLIYTLDNSKWAYAGGVWLYFGVDVYTPADVLECIVGYNNAEISKVLKDFEYLCDYVITDTYRRFTGKEHLEDILIKISE